MAGPLLKVGVGFNDDDRLVEEPMTGVVLCDPELAIALLSETHKGCLPR